MGYHQSSEPISLATGSVYPTFGASAPAAVAAGHVVPARNKLQPGWGKSLFDKGEPKVYRGKELFTIGMPCGGIGAGQLYVRGDGTLAKWWIFNNARNERHCSGYQTYEPKAPLEQGFALWIKNPSPSAPLPQAGQGEEVFPRRPKGNGRRFL